MLRNALAHSRAWHDAGLTLAVAVNVSGRDIVDLGLADEVGRMLAEERLSPTSLELEITESTLMTDPIRATQVLERLSALGVRIAIDDFGSGYSSLSHLAACPVDVLKIDKSFVLQMDTDESDETIVRSTIDLAHNLGLCVVAEGVESRRRTSSGSPNWAATRSRATTSASRSGPRRSPAGSSRGSAPTAGPILRSA